MLLKIGGRLLPYIALLVAVTIWGGLPAVTKLTLSGISVSLFITIRFVFSSVFLSPLIFRVVKKSKKLSLVHWCTFVVTISVMFYSQTWAIHQVPAPLYIVLFSAKAIINSAAIGLVLPLAFFGYSYALRKKPVISIFGQYLEPIIGIMIAALLIGGTISTKQSIAFAWVLIGVSLLSKYSKSSDSIAVSTT